MWDIPSNSILVEGDATGRKLLAARPPCKGILDFSKVTKVDASSETIKRIASKPAAYGLAQAVGLVAPEDVVYGLSRMFVTLGERKLPKMYVVRTMEEAYHLLEIHSLQFQPYLSLDFVRYRCAHRLLNPISPPLCR